MSQVKYLDLQGLKVVFGVVDSKVSKAVADKASKAELQAVEAKVDAIDVEASLEGYAKESYVDSAISGLNISQYAVASEVENTYAKKSDLTGLASESFVENAIEEAKEAIVGEDLKDSLDTLESIKSWKEEHGTEYTNLLAEVQKKADASSVYTKGETDEKIAEVVAGSVDLTPYAKTAEVAETYATKAQLEGYQVKGDYLTEEDIEDLASEEYVDDAIEALNISQYAKTADLDTFVPFTKEEIEGAASAE